MFGGLIKAAVGLVIETPVAIIADVVTLGGAINEKDTTYTGKALSKVVENITDSTK